MFDIKVDEAAITEEKDTLGNGGSFKLDSGVYDMTISEVYAKESSGGAIGLHVTFSDKNSKKSFNETYYLTNRNKQNTYVDKKTKEKKTLPGFNQGNTISLLAAGKPIVDAIKSVEKKTIQLYSFEAGKKVNTEVEMVMDLLNKEITVGVIKQIVNKRTKQGNEYVPIAETREENIADKFFRATDKRTVTEISAESPAKFVNEWSDNWTGDIRDKTDKSLKAETTESDNTPTKSLFED